MSEDGKETVRADDEVVARAEVLALQKQIRELQRVLGKNTLENKILREAVKSARKNSSRACRRDPRRIRREARGRSVGRVPIAADAANERPMAARSSYCKSEDAQLLAPLRTLVDERPTYGYRCMTALLNRERRKNALPRLNHKRIYRLKSQNGMCLQRRTGEWPGRAHEGQIITIRPNLRWTLDALEIACWNGGVVGVAFALDTCNREVTAWCASSGGVSGEMVRDLMVEGVERRFGARVHPHPIRRLSDSGNCYRAHETIEIAIRLGLVPCFTSVRSPQSDGMAEAFAKTFKRDYVYIHDRPDAQTLSQLSAWFEDYNESHPHKALQMKSPREFIRSYQSAACPV